MSTVRMIGAAGVVVGAALLLSACGSSEPVSPAPSAPMSTPSVSTDASAASGGVPSPVATLTTRQVSGTVEVDAGGYFLFPSPPNMTTGGSTPDDWRWTLSYDKDMLIAANEVTVAPESADDVAFGSADSGVVWQARDKAGQTVMRYSYVNPDEPLVTVSGEYTVTVK